MNIRRGAGVFHKVLGPGDYPTVLEIGTYRGVSAAEMSRYCERVHTIDLKHGRLEQLGLSCDRAAFWESLGVENVTLHLVENDAEKKRVISSLEFDLAFIDAGKDDIEQDFALVKHCGAVLFHDYDDRGQPALNAVYDFVNSLPREQVLIMDIFAFWKANGHAYPGV